MINKLPFNRLMTTTSTTYLPYIPMNLSYYQNDHLITVECIDCLLRIYATKALDYQINDSIISTSSSSSEYVPQSNDLVSIDSLSGIFVMPKNPPTKDHWIKDEDATHCMCCKRTLFTMIMRRHHCRRCGRVICYQCSTNRMKIQDLYDEVPVRICNDCVKQTEDLIKSNTNTIEMKKLSIDKISSSYKPEWELNGKLSHDQLLRDEFFYEHAPNVSLCLTILSYHKNNKKYIDLLLYHLYNLEKLLRPNPEVDYALVAKMINCLAFAAKVRGGPPEVDKFRDHSEIILSVARNGCEHLLPIEPINNYTLKKLADSLVTEEKWDLALDVFLKCGFQKSGVNAAYGLACLRAGCFETARENFSYCMLRHCLASDISIILQAITNDDNDTDIQIQQKSNNIPIIKRSKRSPPLLEEIVKIIENTSIISPQPETITRANLLSNSNLSSSSSSNRLKLKLNLPMYVPALEILNTLSNLKQITSGNYYDKTLKSFNYQINTDHNEDNRNISDNHFISSSSSSSSSDKFSRKKTFIFEECLYYLLTYGTHSDVINFLIKYEQLRYALKYYLMQNLNFDIFIQSIYLKYLHTGNIEKLINQMLEIDDRLTIWRNTIMNICRYLEIKKMYNSLYQLQVLLNDQVRASITCIKFYSLNCLTFNDLQMNTIHLKNAQLHLNNELEICSKWENINLDEKNRQQKSNYLITKSEQSIPSSSSSSSSSSYLMVMDKNTIKMRLQMIQDQIVVTEFLSKCENDTNLSKRTKQILKEIRLEIPNIPTLFHAEQDRIQICILILLCGQNIEEGFDLSHKIISNYKLPPLKIYGPTAKYLSHNNRLNEVEMLINCIRREGGVGGGGEGGEGGGKRIKTGTNENTTKNKFKNDNNKNVNNDTAINQLNNICDEILSTTIQNTVNNHETEIKITLDNLVKRITDIEMKISCYIYLGQLKSAYLLSVQYNRLNDIRRILRQSEMLNQTYVKKLCEKKLNMIN